MKENRTLSIDNNLAQIREMPFDQVALRPIYKMLECLFIRTEGEYFEVPFFCHKWD